MPCNQTLGLDLYLSRGTANSNLECLKLKRKSVENVELVNVNWLTACNTKGKPVTITESYRIKYSNPKEEYKPSDQQPSSNKDVKYICQRPAPLNHPNKIFTDALEVLERHAIYKDSSQRDIRALAFRRAACSLKSLPKKVEKMVEVAKLSHLGNHSRKVIQEILEKGVCDEVEEIRKSDFFHAMENFSPVYGCGPATGRKWFEQGYRSIEDVRQALKDKTLKVTNQQLVGIRFYESVVNGVSRSEADAITQLVTTQLDDLEPGCTIQLVGGYRRGKTSGHDVDLLITHPDDNKISHLLVKLVDRLEHLGHIVHKDISVGKTPIHRTDDKKKTVGGVMDQHDHCFCMFKMDTSDEKKEVTPDLVRRVDLIVAPMSQYPWTLLGWTGSKQFNRSLRLYATKELNIAVSNHGAWDRSKTPPQSIEATNERDIFAALNLTYREPEERNC
ncbi:DNA-directed DNA/RNA polymerase mu-like [Actinia tenebrosa]|uniref:DNA-directed DNA/RNA polymerase mu-like n=1 Tax=Actinia tenebrosa TaxID=6105 RepID=A0A6P8JAH1_ACTTE|nr:DNA-directed DNA/RNA polymerase mu-like [Actinia tenebrosa]